MSIIPASVLRLLRQEWRSEGDSSDFERNFRGDRDRSAHPSYYHIKIGAERESNFDTFSYEEAKSLVDAEVFGDLNDYGVSINEHAQHALTGFLGDAYDAWRTFQRRLKEIEAIGIFPNH